MVLLTFCINYHTQPSETVCITGSNKELGEWTKPVKMEWSENDQWTVSLEIDNIPFEYKYLIMTVPESNIQRWEATNNRTFFLFHTVEAITINDVWDQPSNTHMELKVC